MASKSKTNTSVDMNDMIINGVLSVVSKSDDNSWMGTMTELNSLLIKTLGKRTALPGSPSSLRVTLNRVVNRLRVRGITVRFGRTPDHSRTRFVEFSA